MGEWELRDPWFLLLVLTLPWLYRVAVRPRSLMQFSSLQHLGGLATTLRQRLVRLPVWLMITAFVLLIIALARPRTPQNESRVSGDGIAIMMVVDLSSSMNARDLVPDDPSVNRLDVVKEVFTRFVLGNQEMPGREHDLVGLVTFAGYADSLCPLTLDHGNLSSIVGDLRLVQREEEDGTAIGDGLGLAIERLRRSDVKSKVAILLTDGVTTAGVIDPLEAAKLAKDNQVKVYCIGAGTNGQAPVPGVDIFGRTVFMTQRVEIDEETLRQIAEETGGAYYRAVDAATLSEIYQTIDQLERTEVTEIRYREYTEHFSSFVMASLICIVVSVLLNGTVFRRLP